MILSAKPFRIERHMLEPLAIAARGLVAADAGDRLSILREPQIGSVIPDILLGVWPAARPLVSRPSCTIIEAHIASLLEPLRSLRPMEIAERLHVGEDFAAPYLRRMLRGGLLKEAPGRRISLAPQFATVDVEIIALEAKMRRWREALVQAESYRAFATRAYVVLDGNQVRTSRILVNAFRDAGVGLLYQYDFALTPMVEAASGHRPSALRVIAANRLFASDSQARSVVRAGVDRSVGGDPPHEKSSVPR